MTSLFGFRLLASEQHAANDPLPTRSPGGASALSAKVGGPESANPADAVVFRSAPLASACENQPA